MLNAIVIADDTNLMQVTRHEFAHLFSSRWSRHAPPLLQEGLSVWLEDSTASRPTEAAITFLLADPNLKLHRLLDRRFFFSATYRSACYVLAGSFTGFLIRRYGWECFRQLYRSCNGRHFLAKFTRCFGVSLEKAEWQWCTELQLMDVLKRRRKSCLDI